MGKKARGVSRILSCVVIHLGVVLPRPSSDLPVEIAEHVTQPVLLRIGFTAISPLGEMVSSRMRLFNLCHLSGRNIFCCTFRSLAAPSLSLVSSPVKSRLSSDASASATTPLESHDSVQRIPTNVVVNQL